MYQDKQLKETIYILSFEVANTIVKGANLMQSAISEKKNIKYLTEVVLPSEGMQLLISKDIDEQQYITASDKRCEEKFFHAAYKLGLCMI
ncbi:hypothetical protein KSP39_PZI004076 [Platanthera zijinensis]|uniref:DUF3475 domain-containing protein n=1 Tax=Platanthera zijinensis TaxID=2320716 RepID=A0AAP0BXM1_9ASPA